MVDKVNRQKSLLQNENQNAELNRNFSSDQEE